MLRATDLAHLLMRHALQPGDWVVDATVGNGHDTRMLAACVGPSGQVIGFDVQQAALAEASSRLEGVSQIRLIHAGHENLSGYISGERLAGVMFNLGYLPGGEKEIVTRSETTLAALEQALAHLDKHGLVTLIVYPGHPGGMEEADSVRCYTRGLGQDFAVTGYARLNTSRPAPELIAIERVA